MFWVGLSNVERHSFPLLSKAISKTLNIVENRSGPVRVRTKVWETNARAYLAMIDPWLIQYQRDAGQVSASMPDLEQAIELVRTAPDVLSSASVPSTDQMKDLEEAEDWVRQAQQVIRLTRPTGTVNQRRVFQLLLGIDQGLGPTALTVALLFYNAIRFTLTWFVGPLREEEDRTNFTPSWNGYGGYGWLWQLHRIASLLFWVSVVSGIYQLSIVLTTPILVP